MEGDLKQKSPYIFSPSSLSEKKTVALHDWWLVRTETEQGYKALTIVGFTSTSMGRAKRLFKSAPIVKKYSFSHLETSDGIHVIIQGMINEEKMQENGFSLEVSKRFKIGFPLFWGHFVENNTPDPSLINANPDYPEFSYHLNNFLSLYKQKN